MTPTLRLNAKTPFGDALRRHPAVEDVVWDYDIELDNHDVQLTVRRFCDRHNLDLDVFLERVTAAVQQDGQRLGAAQPVRSSDGAD